MKIISCLVAVFLCGFFQSQISHLDSSSLINSNKKMKIEIWSDVACPFCYIGKRKMEAALEEFGHRENFEIEWKSFQLDSTIPKNIDQSIGIYQYLAINKGISLKESKRMHDQVSKMAKEVGLHYDFDKAKISNTLDAARLLHFAKNYGKQDAVKEKLFAAHFVLGLDIANHETLLKLAVEIGLDAKTTREMLETQMYLDAVCNDITEVKNIGISGVPFFVIDRKYSISGAQDVKVFLDVFEKAFQEK